MHDDYFYRISIKALVWENADKKRLLLAKEENGHWELLGGGMAHGEDPYTALSREVKEETGLTITHIASTPSYFYTVQNVQKGFWQAGVVYEAELASLDFTPSEECVELRFFTPEEILRIPAFPNVVILAKEIMKNQQLPQEDSML